MPDAEAVERAADDADVEEGRAEEVEETTASEEVLKGPAPTTNEVFLLGSSLS